MISDVQTPEFLETSPGTDKQTGEKRKAGEMGSD